LIAIVGDSVGEEIELSLTRGERESNAIDVEP
jgi:hypothetical protein